MAIRKTLAKLWRFNGFQNGGGPPCWICSFLCTCLDHPRTVGPIGGVYHSAKFGRNRCSNFNNMLVFKLKMPIQALKMRVLVDLTP